MTETTKPPAVREDIPDLNTKLKGLQLKRDKADETLTGIFVLIAHAMSNEQFGEEPSNP